MMDNESGAVDFDSIVLTFTEGRETEHRRDGDVHRPPVPAVSSAHHACEYPAPSFTLFQGMTSPPYRGTEETGSAASGG
jgi:hypothetical protein